MEGISNPIRGTATTVAIGISPGTDIVRAFGSPGMGRTDRPGNVKPPDTRCRSIEPVQFPFRLSDHDREPEHNAESRERDRMTMRRRGDDIADEPVPDANLVADRLADQAAQTRCQSVRLELLRAACDVLDHALESHQPPKPPSLLCCINSPC